MPRINVLLGAGVVLIVLIFKSSDALASAYGIAVTGVMVISTVLVGVVRLSSLGLVEMGRVRRVRHRLGLVDLAFLASNALKIVQGGWLPLAVAAAVFVVMDTWRVGRRVYMEKVREGSLSLDLFLERADKMQPAHGRHRRVHERAQRHGAQRAAAQPEALQGAA